MARAIPDKKNSKNKQDPDLIHDPVFTQHLLEKLNKSGMVVLDGTGECVYVSNRAEQILGASKDDLLGRVFFEAAPLLTLEGSEIDDRKHPVWRALQPVVYNQVTPFFCKSAEREDVLAMNVMQVREGSKAKAVVVQIRKAEREVNVGEMKTLFVSFAAHQLKTPSSVVKGFLELLMREGQQSYTPDQWNYLISAFESNEQLIHVSKTLLSMARLEGGLIEPQIRTFNPSHAIEGKISSLGPLLKVKELRVVFESEGEEYVNSDDTFFLEIFEIIFANAIKHSPAGSTITVLCKTAAEGVTVSVADQGSGVPKSAQEGLFKTAQESAQDTNSHGLGLFMAKKYLALLGGSIGLESSTSGSKFYFTVPNEIM
jgi:signal transduction histidine kinase